jgi:hypothetical protein
VKDKIEEISHADNHKGKKMIKRPSLRIHGVQVGAEIQIKSLGNLFKEIIAENVPSLCDNIDTNVQETFLTPT